MDGVNNKPVCCHLSLLLSPYNTHNTVNISDMRKLAFKIILIETSKLPIAVLPPPPFPFLASLLVSSVCRSWQGGEGGRLEGAPGPGQQAPALSRGR